MGIEFLEELRNLGAGHVLGYLVASLQSRICVVELSGVSWTGQGVGRAEVKVKFRKKIISLGPGYYDFSHNKADTSGF